MHLAHTRDRLWRKLWKNNNNKYNKITHLEGCTRQSCPAHTHLSQGLEPSILTVASPQYLSLAFLEGCCLSLSLAVTSLHLDPTTWDPSAPSNRVASSSSTLSRSRWRYSIVLFFFFFFSTTFCLSASSLALAFAFLLAFWATRSAWRASAASCSQRRDCCSSSCCYCIPRCCSSSISASFWERLEWVGEDMIIQKQKWKNSLFHLYIVDLGTIMEFSGKTNRTSKVQS